MVARATGRRRAILWLHGLPGSCRFGAAEQQGHKVGAAAAELRACERAARAREDVQLELTGWEEAEAELRTRWRFSGVLQLPWRPRLAAAGGTTHVFSLARPGPGRPCADDPPLRASAPPSPFSPPSGFARRATPVRREQHRLGPARLGLRRSALAAYPCCQPMTAFYVHSMARRARPLARAGLAARPHGRVWRGSEHACACAG